MICLDTNAVIHAINGRRPMVRERLQAALAGGMTVGISAIVLFELHYGVGKSDRPEANAAALAVFLALGFELWPFCADDAVEAGALRAALARAGTPIGPYDLLIAAQARRRGALLISANEREFSRVTGLATADWTA